MSTTTIMLAISPPPKAFRSGQLRVNNVGFKSLPVKSPLTITTTFKMSGPCAAPSTTTAPLIPDKILPNLYLAEWVKLFLRLNLATDTNNSAKRSHGGGSSEPKL